MRQLRTDANLSLATVAESAGISLGLLSQIERGKGNPSLTTMVKLATALGVPMSRFFVGEQPPHALIRKGKHPRLQIADDQLVYELLTPQTHNRLGMIRAEIPSGCSNEDAPFRHEGEECIYLLEGELIASLDGTIHHLHEGDSLTLDPWLPHWYRNETDRGAVAVTAMTPRSF
jgi:transcriptional regulator with XRE-family HTH domain